MLRRFVGSQTFVVAACIGLGLTVFPAATPDVYPDPDAVAAVQVPQAPALEPYPLRVRAVMHKAVRMDPNDRPAYFAAVLADPTLSDEERDILARVIRLFLLTRPQWFD